MVDRLTLGRGAAALRPEHPGHGPWDFQPVTVKAMVPAPHIQPDRAAAVRGRPQ